jgi:hypothetical protein
VEVDFRDVGERHIIAILICQHLVVMAGHGHLMTFEGKGGQRQNIVQASLYDEGHPKGVEVWAAGDTAQGMKDRINEFFVESDKAVDAVRLLLVGQVCTLQNLVAMTNGSHRQAL